MLTYGGAAAVGARAAAAARLVLPALWPDLYAALGDTYSPRLQLDAARCCALLLLSLVRGGKGGSRSEVRGGGSCVEGVAAAERGALAGGVLSRSDAARMVALIVGARPKLSGPALEYVEPILECLGAQENTKCDSEFGTEGMRTRADILTRSRLSK
jgi:hypothetical protein